MTIIARRMVFFGIVLLFAAGCAASSPTSTPTSQPSLEPPTAAFATTVPTTTVPPTTTPTNAAQSATPLAVAAASNTTNGDPTKGKSVFVTTCARCHGRYAELSIGRNRRALSDPKTYKVYTEAQITDLILNGNKEMPAFSRYLSKSELTNLLAYLYSFAE